LGLRHIQAFGRAADDFRKVLDARPDDDDARLLLADCLIQNSQAPEAVPYLLDLRTRRPKDTDLLLKLAFAWNMDSKIDEARALPDEILPEHPDLGPALSARGQIELQLRTPAGAERWLRQALKATPYEDRQTHYTLSQALRQQDKEKEAEEEEARVQKIEETIKRMLEVRNRLLPARPTDPKLNHELAALMLELGHAQEAERWFLKALQYDPGFEPTHRALADYYTRKGDTQRAEFHRSHVKSRQ